MLLDRDEAHVDRLRAVGESDVRMRLDQSGHQRCALAVDLSRVVHPRRLLRAPHLADALALDQHASGEWRGTSAVEHLAVDEQDTGHGTALPRRDRRAAQRRVGSAPPT
jgi:hypothetical protein